MLRYALLVAVINLSTFCGNALFVSVDANEEQCFFERVTSGTKMNFMFEVAEGGFLDIDVKIVGPDSKQVYKGERESSGKFTFSAHMDGVYTYCFGNKMSTMTPKIVMFTMNVLSPHSTGTPPAEGNEEQNKLTEMVNELKAGLISVKHEQEYMEIRQRIHRAINESTNSRVVMWAIFEAVVLITMTAGQIYYLKRFFENMPVLVNIAICLADSRNALIALIHSYVDNRLSIGRSTTRRNRRGDH
ncbi:hypothetical protein M514_01627 [Trichuris suis]|uniref:GOLD domain-containing protein n=1 Tax=Trichuris suis TaxID=68888 RepID=A0A085MJX8_9BILA|nr:hypothetical protein M513_01627 [Trichuris suis]KFD63559.1 hypothetical protein M514_01627 [Trichuris suis]